MAIPSLPWVTQILLAVVSQKILSLYTFEMETTSTMHQVV